VRDDIATVSFRPVGGKEALSRNSTPVFPQSTTQDARFNRALRSLATHRASRRLIDFQKQLEAVTDLT
jgi:hypothetical protein